MHKERKQLVTWMHHNQLRVGSNQNSPLCHHLSIRNSSKYMHYFECPLLKFYLCKIVGDICELILIFFQDILVQNLYKYFTLGSFLCGIKFLKKTIVFSLDILKLVSQLAKAIDLKEIRDIIAKDSRGDNISLVLSLFSMYFFKFYIHSYYVFLVYNDQLRKN